MAEQSRRFCGILYPDAENYDCDYVLTVIREYFDEWAYILHDKDVLEESGALKKAHYHWVGSLQNPVQISTIINRLEVPPQSVEFIKKRGGKSNWKGAVKYLIHENNPEKFQYDVNAVVTNFDVLRFLGNNDEVHMIKKIVNFIRENPNCLWYDVYSFAVANGCYSEFRRSQQIIKDLIKEMRGKEVL